jgi:penicillin-insensitive murein endopeptidase
VKRLILLMLLALTPPAQAETVAAKLFAAKDYPTSGPAQPIGTYARGCASGNVQLPETGPTWQAMRLSRDPRGGPMISGHASHQMGLDADVWFLPPASLTLTAQQREAISSIAIRSRDQLSVSANYNPSFRAVLKAAASDPRVDRIFVAAAVKIEMCKTATAADARWLQHIRPEAGHEDHFHVRLKCPPGAALCQTQKPTVSDLSKGGSGCDDTLAYWVSDAYLHPKPVKNPGPKPPHKKGPREFTMADLPAQCAAVLSAD